jgi:hypothetical protein
MTLTNECLKKSFVVIDHECIYRFHMTFFLLLQSYKQTMCEACWLCLRAINLWKSLLV